MSGRWAQDENGGSCEEGTWSPTAEDRRELVSLLIEMPEFGTAEGRRALLDLAGVSSLASRIDFSGPAFVAANSIVSHLAAYGRVSLGQRGSRVVPEHRSATGGGRAARTSRFAADEVLDDGARVRATGLGPWHGSADAQSVEEKIIGANTLRPVAFLVRAWRASRAGPTWT